MNQVTLATKVTLVTQVTQVTPVTQVTLVNQVTLVIKVTLVTWHPSHQIKQVTLVNHNWFLQQGIL